jgi:hypothetical protein
MPYEIDGYSDKITETLTQAQLSIHLFDQFTGRSVDDWRAGVCLRKQFELAFENRVPQLIWVPDILEISEIGDKNHAAFLDVLENGIRENNNYEFVRSSFQRLSELILQTIRKLKGRRESAAESHVYLIDTHQKDQQVAYRLAGILADKGRDVDFNKESRDSVENVNIFEESVNQVRHLIIVFGKVGSRWVDGRIKKCLKSYIKRFECGTPTQLEKIWIYLMPDSKHKNQLPRLPRLIPIEILDNTHSDEIDPNVISALLH